MLGQARLAGGPGRPGKPEASRAGKPGEKGGAWLAPIAPQALDPRATCRRGNGQTTCLLLSHKLTAPFPDCGATRGSQMRLGGASVPANIVEGDGPPFPADRLRFLNIAEASLADFSYYAYTCAGGSVTSPEDDEGQFESMAKQTGAPLVGLIRQMKRLPSEYSCSVCPLAHDVDGNQHSQACRSMQRQTG